MAKIVGIGAPCDFQIGKHIAIVDCQDSLGRLLDVLISPPIQVGIGLLVEAYKARRQFFGCLCA